MGGREREEEVKERKKKKWCERILTSPEMKGDREDLEEGTAE